MRNWKQIELLSFEIPSVDQYRELLENQAVNQHLPLADESYSDQWIVNWIERKANTWPEPKCGPWSVWVDGEFAGWSGVEPDGDVLSYGVVLLPSFWGIGNDLTAKVLGEVARLFPKHASVDIELPKSRRSEKVASRLGLESAGQRVIAGFEFDVYRLSLEPFRN